MVGDSWEMDQWGSCLRGNTVVRGLGRDGSVVQQRLIVMREKDISVSDWVGDAAADARAIRRRTPSAAAGVRSLWPDHKVTSRNAHARRHTTLCEREGGGPR